MAVSALSKMNSPKRITQNWGHLQEVNVDTYFLIVHQFIDSFYATREQGKEKALRREGMLLKPRREGQRAFL